MPAEDFGGSAPKAVQRHPAETGAEHKPLRLHARTPCGIPTLPLETLTMRTLPCLLAVLALLLCVPACGEPSEELETVGDKLGETWGAVKDYGVKKRKDFEAWSTKAFDGFDEKYEAAKKKAAEAGGDAAKVLDQQWGVAQEKLAALKSASADGWDKAKGEFVGAMDALKETMDKDSE